MPLGFWPSALSGFGYQHHPDLDNQYHQDLAHQYHQDFNHNHHQDLDCQCHWDLDKANKEEFSVQ